MTDDLRARQDVSEVAITDVSTSPGQLTVDWEFDAFGLDSFQGEVNIEPGPEAPGQKETFSRQLSGLDSRIQSGSASFDLDIVEDNDVTATVLITAPVVSTAQTEVVVPGDPPAVISDISVTPSTARPGDTVSFSADLEFTQAVSGRMRFDVGGTEVFSVPLRDRSGEVSFSDLREQVGTGVFDVRVRVTLVDFPTVSETAPNALELSPGDPFEWQQVNVNPRSIGRGQGITFGGEVSSQRPTTLFGEVQIRIDGETVERDGVTIFEGGTESVAIRLNYETLAQRFGLGTFPVEFRLLEDGNVRASTSAGEITVEEPSQLAVVESCEVSPPNLPAGSTAIFRAQVRAEPVGESVDTRVSFRVGGVEVATVSENLPADGGLYEVTGEATWQQIRNNAGTGPGKAVQATVTQSTLV